MAPTNRRNKKANNTIKIQRLQKQLDNLQQMNDCKHKRCYLAGCSDKEIKSLCQWIHRAWYDDLNVDDATRKRLKNPLKSKTGKRLVSVLADQTDSDIDLKRRLLLHRDATKKLFPVLFKYLIPSVRNILADTIDELEKGETPTRPKKLKKKPRKYKKKLKKSNLKPMSYYMEEDKEENKEEESED